MAHRLGISALEEGVLSEEHPGANLKRVHAEHPLDGELRFGGELPAVPVVLGEDLDAEQLGILTLDAQLLSIAATASSYLPASRQTSASCCCAYALSGVI